jgi:hypothetical protein
MENPQLRLLSRPAGSLKALVFIDGYLSENKERGNILLSALARVSWCHSVYQLWWDSGLKESCWMGLGIGHWHKTKSRAERVGRDYLPSYINNQIPEQKVCLVTHSLGARVAYYYMEAWSESQHSLEDIILLGGAVRRDSSKDWGYVASKLRGTLINVYNDEDPTLKRDFKLAEAGNNACGRKPIKEYHLKIRNENGTSFIGKTHSLSGYLNYLPELINKGLWRI